MKITVVFDDTSVLECEKVINGRKFWRFVSKHCNYTRKHYGYTPRVISVYRSLNGGESV